MSKKTAKTILEFVSAFGYAFMIVGIVALFLDRTNTCAIVLAYIGGIYILRAIDKAIKSIEDDIKRGDNK